MLWVASACLPPALPRQAAGHKTATLQSLQGWQLHMSIQNSASLEPANRASQLVAIWSSSPVQPLMSCLQSASTLSSTCLAACQLASLKQTMLVRFQGLQ